jgi:hypothetical protein
LKKLSSRGSHRAQKSRGTSKKSARDKQRRHRSQYSRAHPYRNHRSQPRDGADLQSSPSGEEHRHGSESKSTKRRRERASHRREIHAHPESDTASLVTPENTCNLVIHHIYYQNGGQEPPVRLPIRGWRSGRSVGDSRHVSPGRGKDASPASKRNSDWSGRLHRDARLFPEDHQDGGPGPSVSRNQRSNYDGSPQEVSCLDTKRPF